MITLEDVMIAARTVYGEARGEPHPGKLAVVHVMLNRLRSKDGQFERDDTLATTCLRYLQFSDWNPGDPNFRLIQEITPDNQVFRGCMAAVLEALEPAANDPTGGATHYCTINLTPTWAKGADMCAVIGNHKFFRNVV